MLSLYDLTCEHEESPLGLALKTPRFSWKLRSDTANTLQAAYRLQIFCEKNLPETGNDAADSTDKTVLWDSGLISSDASVLVKCGLPVLEPETQYTWQVNVNDNQDRTAVGMGSFETGLGNWESPIGKWITGDAAGVPTADLASPLLRKSFTIEKTVTRARLYVTAQGVYEVSLNGKRVGEDYMTPGWTSYLNRIQYQTFDITASLLAGENAMGASFGNGWFTSTLGWQDNREIYGKERAILAELHLSYADGSTEVIATDESWKSHDGPTLCSEIYHGETYDARLEVCGWDKAGLADADWQPVRTVQPVVTKLIPQEGESVRIHEMLKPVEVITTPDGDTVLDFGQNITGFVRFTVDGPEGATLTLEHAEVFDKDGNFYLGNMRSAKNLIHYTLKGKGPETWNPKFTFQGFRLVRIKTENLTWAAEQFTACVLHSEMRTSASFTCARPLVNQLYKNIIWGQKGNFLDVPTDCPQRDERLGWTGDAQAFVRTACTNMDAARFFTKWLHDLSADQLPDGGVPFVIPDVFAGKPDQAHSSAAWGDAATICPWTVYRCYNEKELLEEQFPSMKKWVDWITAQGGDGLWNIGFHFGDWLGLDAKPDSYIGATPTDLIATAFYAYSTQLLLQAAAVLGYREEIAAYEPLHQKIVDRFRAEFVTPNGRLAAPTQTGHVLALHFDLLKEADRPRAIKDLAKLVEDNDTSLTTGFVGTPYLCHVLTRFGRHDLAGKLLLREKYPSWLYPVTKGATTIWEHWDGIKEDGSFWSADMNSFNHYAYGAIGDWLFQVVAGIDMDAAVPAYKKIIVRPQPFDGMPHAEASLETPYGTVRSSWTVTDDAFKLSLDIPANTTATVFLPGKADHEAIEIGSGNGQSFTV